MSKAHMLADPPTAPIQGEDEAQKARELISAIAERIVARGLEAPAVLFLELHKPLAFILGQAAIVAAPLWGLFLSPEEIESACRLLGSRQSVEALIERVESLSAEQRGRSTR